MLYAARILSQTPVGIHSKSCPQQDCICQQGLFFYYSCCCCCSASAGLILLAFLVPTKLASAAQSAADDKLQVIWDLDWLVSAKPLASYKADAKAAQETM